MQVIAVCALSQTVRRATRYFPVKLCTETKARTCCSAAENDNLRHGHGFELPPQLASGQ